jgi:hypothetical protein
MQATTTQKIKLELLWWVLTALAVTLIMAPIYFNIDDYRFWDLSVMYIVIFMTTARYIFLWPTTLLARQQLVKIGIILVVIPIIFMLIQELNRYQAIIDNSEPETIVGLMPLGPMNAMMQYTRAVMLLFGVGSIISLIILPFRMMVSVWRQRNLGKP